MYIFIVLITDGFFQGWSPLLLLVTILTALGGILVSLVMKYACNVRKTYCQTLAIGQFTETNQTSCIRLYSISRAEVYKNSVET